MTTKIARHPWTAAFVAYCNGSPIDEIAQVFDIPLKMLHAKMAGDGWAGLRARLPLATLQQTDKTGEQRTPTGLIPAIAAKLELLQQNRDANLSLFVQLREHATEMVRALRDGTLRMDRLFHFKGTVAHEDALPGPADWVNIAAYARTIADGTYRALGDFQSQEKAGQDTAAGASAPQGPAITIILPAAIARPRGKRSIDIESRVVESGNQGLATELLSPPPAREA